LKWRIQRAVKLLIDGYGGINNLRISLYALVLLVSGTIVVVILSALGHINIWVQIIRQTKQIWILVSSIISVLIGIVPSLRLLYNTSQNAGQSRGETIYQKSKMLKDKIGFMDQVKQELDDLFNFMRVTSENTKIELKLLIFVMI